MKIKEIKKSHLLVYLFLIAYAVVSVYPVIWMVFYSLKTNEEIFVSNPFGPPRSPVWSNYIEALTKFHLTGYIKNSVVVSVSAVALGILCSLMFTYVVSRAKTRVTNAARSIVVAGMFIPIQAVMTPLVVMVRNLGLSNTAWSLIIPYMATGFPFAVMVLHGFYSGLPMELEESAYMDGAGFYQTFFRIIVPQLKPIISVLIIYQFMSCWNEFSLALILITKDKMKTLPLGLAGFFGQYSTNWGLVGAALVLASVPVTVIYLLLGSRISDAMTYSGLKG